MFETKVYTTAILSLNGMMDETHTAREAVAAFRQRVQPHCRCLEYRGTAQLRQRVEEAIEALIIH